jgi:hypothetical protein
MLRVPQVMLIARSLTSPLVVLEAVVVALVIVVVMPVMWMALEVLRKLRKQTKSSVCCEQIACWIKLSCLQTVKLFLSIIHQI